MGARRRLPWAGKRPPSTVDVNGRRSLGHWTMKFFSILWGVQDPYPDRRAGLFWLLVSGQLVFGRALEGVE